jgi:leucine dehydrogenase
VFRLTGISQIKEWHVTVVTKEQSVDLWAGEQIVCCHDTSVGLRAVIAIDRTVLGPSLGGIRMERYPSYASGITECQRLAAAMSRKHALAGLPYGGGKAVIFDDGPVADRVRLMRRFGEFVRRTGGSYIPGVDMGTSTEDLVHVGEGGAEVCCAATDPAHWTALGVLASIRAAVARLGDHDGLAGAHVLIQGAGHVGSALARQLVDEGAIVTICDINPDRARAVAATHERVRAVAAERAFTIGCDVFAPCASSAVLDARTATSVSCRIVAGAANDTLATPEADRVLRDRRITYVPDFVANAGGVIQIHAERRGWDEARLTRAVLAIGERVSALIDEARATDGTPLQVAEAHAAALLDPAGSAGA